MAVFLPELQTLQPQEGSTMLLPPCRKNPDRVAVEVRRSQGIRRRLAKPSFRPTLEPLEDRVVPADLGFTDKVGGIAVDSAGSVYIGGHSANGSETSWIDFDPHPTQTA